jgi:cell division septation protein DedD
MLQFILLATISISFAAALPATPAPVEECQTICWDGVNECGMWYGGCYPEPKCAGVPAPVFTPPSCPSSSPREPNPCTMSICYDGIDECGQGFGGCTLAPVCGGPVSPTFFRPSCSLTTPPPVAETTPCSTTTKKPKITQKPKVTPKQKQKPAGKTTSCSTSAKQPKTRNVYHPAATATPTRRYV